MLLCPSPRRLPLFIMLFFLAWDPLAADRVFGQFQAEEVPSATEIRVLDPGWWPTKGSGQRAESVGSAACQACHREILERQQNTPMAHALTQAGPSALEELSSSPVQFSIGPFKYELGRSPGGAALSVGDGSQSTAAPVAWIFGNGQFGPNLHLAAKRELLGEPAKLLSANSRLGFHDRQSPGGARHWQQRWADAF